MYFKEIVEVPIKKGNSMTGKEFAKIRKRLGKTQKEMAQLLALSLKTIHSYEQGWRNIPPHIERQLLFIVSLNEHNNLNKSTIPCWEVISCPENKRKGCPAWEFQKGNLCWFINGTFCKGVAQKDWKEKMKICRRCKMFPNIRMKAA